MRRYELRAAPLTVLIGRPGLGPHCAVTTRLANANGLLRAAVGVVSSRGALAELRLLAGQEHVTVEVFVSRAAALEELGSRQVRAARRYLLRCAHTQRQTESTVAWCCGRCWCAVSWCIAP